MQKKKVKTATGAKVELTIQIHNLGSWSPQCPMDQIYDQAIRAAEHVLNKAFESHHITVVGKPKVTAITTSME